LHFVKKTYGHELGLSTCFRQHRAKSHCRFLHGYPLSFTFTFAATQRDENGWVIDFPRPGGQLADVLVVPAVGCEAFAAMAWQRAELLLEDMGIAERVSLTELEVREHGANGVIYTGE
jgi:6-pyruvoyltetrahydropterin/6-carboxytetrahydropterin synthase